jgi:hypothetical protein
LSLGRGGDVGSAFAASAVESVAAGAAIFERLASLGDRTLILRCVTLRDGCTFDGEGERASDDGDRNISESFESARPRRMVCSHEHNFYRIRKISDCSRLLTSRINSN